MTDKKDFTASSVLLTRDLNIKADLSQTWQATGEFSHVFCICVWHQMDVIRCSRSHQSEKVQLCSGWMFYLYHKTVFTFQCQNVRGGDFLCSCTASAPQQEKIVWKDHWWVWSNQDVKKHWHISFSIAVFVLCPRIAGGSCELYISYMNDISYNVFTPCF